MGEIVARFADGRLLVQEEKALESYYVSGGIAFRIGHLKTVERVLSINASISGRADFPFFTHLKEVKTSGDTIIPILRIGLISGGGMSGCPSLTGVLSGLFASGKAINEQLTSSQSQSGLIRILANVIGY